MSESFRTPWRTWLHAALGLGLAPDAFWRLSLVEWRALAGLGEGPALNRAQFERLAMQFPDEDHGTN